MCLTLGSKNCKGLASCIPMQPVQAVPAVVAACLPTPPARPAGFGLFAVWILSPFVTRRKTFHAAVVFKRVLVILVTLQTLRIITFLSTQVLPFVLPGCVRASMWGSNGRGTAPQQGGARRLVPRDFTLALHCASERAKSLCWPSTLFFVAGPSAEEQAGCASKGVDGLLVQPCASTALCPAERSTKVPDFQCRSPLPTITAWLASRPPHCSGRTTGELRAGTTNSASLRVCTGGRSAVRRCNLRWLSTGEGIRSPGMPAACYPASTVCQPNGGAAHPSISPSHDEFCWLH
jgi:hypothetical protein